jgi:hypothetical protein
VGYSITEITTTKGAVRPQLVATATAQVIAWVEERGGGVHVARRTGDHITTVTHDLASAGVRLVAGRDAVWAAWDVGETTNCGVSYHADGVSLRAGTLDGDALVGTEVSDQLWQWCTGRAYEIAIAPDGEPRIAYVVRDRVFHARRDGGGWVVDKGPIAEQETLAFAIDPRGRSHVLYRRDDVLCHAVHDGGTWKQTKLTERYCVHHPSIALDTESRPHIAYMNTTKSKDQLFYATQHGDAFTHELVDKKGNVGFGSKIAIAADGTPWISYRAEHSRDGASSRRITEVEHRIAIRANNKWTIENVAIGGAGNAFVLAPTPVIAFVSSTRGNLSLATREP